MYRILRSKQGYTGINLIPALLEMSKIVFLGSCVNMTKACFSFVGGKLIPNRWNFLGR